MGTARDVQKPGHKMSELDHYWDSDKFTHREKIALRYCDAIIGNPLDANAELWKLLHSEFTEPELVELGFFIGFKSGAQRWIITLGTRHGELGEALGIPTPTPEVAYRIKYGSD